MKQFLSLLGAPLLFAMLLCGLSSTAAANTSGTASIHSVSAKRRHHTTRHRPHKTAKRHRQRRHHAA